MTQAKYKKYFLVNPIKNTTWMYVPAGVMHCPLDFKRVDKPIMFGHIMMIPTYKAITDDKNFSSVNEEVYIKRELFPEALENRPVFKIEKTVLFKGARFFI